MPMPTDSGTLDSWLRPSDDAPELSLLEKRIPPLLSVIAGMVDLIGILTLGNIFTAHITGNLVVFAAVLVRGGSLNWRRLWQFLSSSSPLPPFGCFPGRRASAVRTWRGSSSWFSFCCSPGF
jgi:hypothetical protein